jgi:hypothetical protein
VLANLHVNFGGERGLSARWAIVPASGDDLIHLSLIGERGKAIVTMRGDDFSCCLADQHPATGSTTTADMQQTFERLTGAMSTEFYDDFWLAACRDQEAAEAVDRSLARGRTIELMNEEHTEASSFKGVMAMGGCLLLMMAVAVVCIATVVEGLRLPVRGWAAWRMWPVLLLAPIVVFLVLQLLHLAVKREAPKLSRLSEHGQSGT